VLHLVSASPLSALPTAGREDRPGIAHVARIDDNQTPALDRRMEYYISNMKSTRETQRMNRLVWLMAGRLLLISGMAVSPAALADFELTGPDGRRILLQQNGTWRYVEAKGKEETADKAKVEGDLVLVLERKIERDRGCRFGVGLTNNLPYEVQNLVLYYSAYRANGVIYDTVSAGSAFASLKPGDKQTRDFEFVGLTCRDIVRVQVVGGDRCNMGDLNRWSDQAEYKGQCLARVRVEESKLVRFDK
jgi:hypothetical protein